MKLQDCIKGWSLGIALWLSAAGAVASQEGQTDALMVDGVIYIRTSFGAGQYLTRKIELSGGDRGNDVVNLAGARIVPEKSKDLLNVGYVVAGEGDDAAPVKFNGTYIGANHGAFFGVKLPCTECSSLAGTTWKDSEGTKYRAVSAGKESAVVVSEPQGAPGSWQFKLQAKGPLKQIDGSRVLATDNQIREQIYPSVRRVSMSVKSQGQWPLTAKFQKANQVEVTENYQILSPVDERLPVATMTVRYVFRGLRTDIETTFESLSTLNAFSIGGTQAGPINYTGGRLEQMVANGAVLSTWTDRAGKNEALRIEAPGTTAMQRIVDGPYAFGQTIGLASASVNGSPAGKAKRVDISAARKIYPIAFDGLTLKPGDVVKVKAYRTYWPGESP
ncbi:hypothetical protein QU926_20915 [Pseudomonas asiatica]|uniref:hypothetical protein n=1 Tax=Pseudomonas asiatica TaxID=2219225 RepID=UPI0025AAA02C|nr:hypothetical protein [Pseudomonas asiatica]MDM9556079.1 hypothetical protein [Pseudomonas asiatica]